MSAKRLMLLLGVLLILAAGAAAYTYAAVYSQTARTSFASLDPPTPAAQVTLPPAGISLISTLSGTILSVERRGQVVIALQGGTTVTVAVDGATTYTSGAATASFSALKVGRRVEVRGRVGRSRAPVTVIALSIALQP
jgi:Domain of unknown function (DUF5666)